MLSKITSATLAASLVALGGCAQTEIHSGNDTQAAAPMVITETPQPEEPTAATATAPQAALPNLAIIEFDEQSVQLDSDAQALLTRLIAPAKRADKIVIMGYSDRRKFGNAKEMAISRALKIRNELVKNDIPAKSIRIRYNTEQARHAVKVDLGVEPLHVENDAAANRKN